MKSQLKGALKALLVSFGLIIILMWGVIPGFTKIEDGLNFCLLTALDYHIIQGIILFTDTGWSNYNGTLPPYLPVVMKEMQELHSLLHWL